MTSSHVITRALDPIDRAHHLRESSMDVPRPHAARQRRRRRWMTAAVIVAAGAVVTFLLSRLQPAAPSLDRSANIIETVKRGPMLRDVRGNGTLLPMEIRWVPAVSAGRIDRIPVEVGQAVTADTILVELSDPLLQQEAVAARSLYEAAEAEMQNVRVQVHGQLLTQRAALATAEANYVQAKLEVDVNEQLAKDGLVPLLTLNQSRTKAEQLQKLFAIEKERLEMNPESGKAQIAAQEARVKQLKAHCDLKQQEVAALKVRAGIDGIVQRLGDMAPLQVGQQIFAGANLARVSNPKRLKAEIRIPDTLARDIAMGQPARIDTRNGIVEGTVSRIDPASQNGTVAVDVTLEGPLPRGARPDLAVDGTIELERLADVLNVARPVHAQSESTVGIFKVVENGKAAVRTSVKFGRSSVTTIEIREGLQVGDQIIVSDTSQWDSHDRLRLR